MKKTNGLKTKKAMLKYCLVGAFALTVIGCQTDPVENAQEDIESVVLNENQAISGRYIVVYNNTTGRMPAMAKVKSASEYKDQMRSLKTTFSNEFGSIGLKEENITATIN